MNYEYSAACALVEGIAHSVAGVWGVAEQTQRCAEETRLALEAHTSTAHEPTARERRDARAWSA